MPTMEAAWGFIIIALISKPRLLDFIHLTTMISINIEHTITPTLSAVKTTPKIFIFQYPKTSGNNLFFGPKYCNKH